MRSHIKSIFPTLNPFSCYQLEVPHIMRIVKISLRISESCSITLTIRRLLISNNRSAFQFIHCFCWKTISLVVIFVLQMWPGPQVSCVKKNMNIVSFRSREKLTLNIFLVTQKFWRSQYVYHVGSLDSTVCQFLGPKLLPYQLYDQF